MISRAVSCVSGLLYSQRRYRFRIVPLFIGLLMVSFAVTATAQWRHLDTQPPGDATSMAWDDARNVCVMIVNTATNTRSGDHRTTIWEWSGKGWYEVCEEGPHIASPALVYFPPMKKILIIGGENEHWNQGTTIWSWDGKLLEFVQAGGPWDREYPEVVYSSREQAIYLHGGVIYGSPPDEWHFQDTWKWDGTTWTYIADNVETESNDTYYKATLIYDEYNDELLAFYKFADYENDKGDYGVAQLVKGKWKKISGRFVSGRVFYDRVRRMVIVVDERGWTNKTNIKFNTWTRSGLGPSVKPYSELTTKAERNGTANNVAIAPDGRIMFYGRGLFCSWDENWASRGMIFNNVYDQQCAPLVYDPIHDELFYQGNYPPARRIGQQWLTYCLPESQTEISAMAFDDRSGEIVGLATKNDSPVVRTFSWNGRRWRRIAYPGESPFGKGTLVSDPVSKRFFFFGAINGFGYDSYPVIWELRDNRWEKIFNGRYSEWPFRIIRGVAFDWKSRSLLFLGAISENSLSTYYFKGNTFETVPFSHCPWPYDDPGFSPTAPGYALRIYSDNAHKKYYRNWRDKKKYFEWKHGRWQAGEVMPDLIYRNYTVKAFDSVRGLYLYLFYGANNLYAIGPYSGPTFQGVKGERLILSGDTPIAGRSVSTGSNKDESDIFYIPVRFRLSGKILWGGFFPYSGTWKLGQQGKQTIFGRLGDLPVLGDYDGDGRDEIAVFRPESGEWLTPDRVIATIGGAGMTPVPADYDGDGKTDPAVYDARTGIWRFANGKKLKLGDEDSWPVPADYNGDGKAEIAVWNRTTGVWRTQERILLTFGVCSDVPVPVDTDGDSRAEPSHYRPGTGEWFVNGVWKADMKKYQTVVW